MPIIKRFGNNKSNEPKYTFGMNIKAIRFKETIDYITGKDGKHDPNCISHIVYRNIADEHLASEIMESIASTYSGQAANPKAHYVISYNKGEEITNEQIDKAVEGVLKILKLENASAVYATHEDTSHLHVHICACRVDALTSQIMYDREKKGLIYEPLERLGMQICLEEGRCPPNNGRFYIKNGIIRSNEFLDNEKGEFLLDEKGCRIRNKNYKKSHLSQGARDMEYWNHRLGIKKNKKGERADKSLESIAIERIGDILDTSRNWRELHQRLADTGMMLIKTGSSGLSLRLSEKGKYTVKMRVVNRERTLKKLEKRFNQKYQPAPKNLKVKYRPLTDSILDLGKKMFSKKKQEKEVYTNADHILYLRQERLKEAPSWERDKLCSNYSFHMKTLLNSPYANQEYTPQNFNNTVLKYINEKVRERQEMDELERIPKKYRIGDRVVQYSNWGNADYIITGYAFEQDKPCYKAKNQNTGKESLINIEFMDNSYVKVDKDAVIRDAYRERASEGARRAHELWQQQEQSQVNEREQYRGR